MKLSAHSENVHFCLPLLVGIFHCNFRVILMLSMRRNNQSLIYISASIGIGLFLGVASLLLSPLWVIVGLIGIGSAFVILKRPEVGLLAILAMTSTILFEDRLPLIPIGIGSLNIPDVPLLVLLALIIIRCIAEPKFRFIHTPLDLPLLIFVGMALLSTVAAMSTSSLPVKEALRGFRLISYYLTFFIVTNLVRREKQVLLLVGGMVLFATIVAAAMMAQFVIGTSFNLFPGRVETLVTQGITYGSVTRVLPPGQSLIMFGFIILWVSLAIDNSRLRSIVRFLQAGLVSLAVILTFNRSFYVLGGLALAGLAWLLRAQDKRRLLLWSALAALLGAFVLALALVQSVPQIEGLVQGTLARISTFTSIDTLQEGSLNFRYIENSYAIPQIASHPFIGLGLRAAYRPLDLRLDYYSQSQLISFRSYIHNGHFWVLMDSGWLGYLGLIWFSITFILRGLKKWSSIPNTRMRAIMLACVLTAVGVPVVNIVNPIYMNWIWIPVLGIIMGTGETILRLYQEKASDSVLRQDFK